MMQGGELRGVISEGLVMGLQKKSECRAQWAMSRRAIIGRLSAVHCSQRG